MVYRPPCVALCSRVRSSPCSHATAIRSGALDARADEVGAHLRTALGDLYDSVEVTPLMNDRASMSPMHTPLWDAIESATQRRFPDARMDPGLVVGFTDARVHRELGAVAYGTGLLSPHVSAADFGARFHGNDERIDIDSLALTTQFYLDVVDQLRRA